MLRKRSFATIKQTTNLVESLAIVNTNNGANHLWDNDHVTQMGLNNLWLLIRWGFFLGAAEFLHQSHGLALETSGESPPGAGVQ